MSYLITNIIFYGFQNTINANHIYKNNQKLFDPFVHNYIPTADIKDAALNLIIRSTFVAQLKNPLNKINDWHTFLNNLEESNKNQHSLINEWKFAYNLEYQNTHYVPRSMPITFHGKPFILNIIFYWILHKTWLDYNIIHMAWLTSHNILDYIKRLFLYVHNDFEMNTFRRYLMIDGSITVIVESLLYISPITTFIYFIFILIPRLINKGALGSPILIIFFHVILLARFLF